MDAPWTSSGQRERRNRDKRSERLRRAREAGTHTKQIWLDLVAEFDSRCVICGRRGPVSKDHIVPIYQGGSDAIENIQPLCKPCNSRKGPDSTDWKRHRRERGFGESEA